MNPDEQDPLGLNTYTYVPDIQAIMQSSNLYVYCLSNPIKYSDSIGEATYAIGLGASLSFLIRGGGSAQLVVDDYGNVGIAITQEYGGGFPNIAAGVVLTFTGADTIFDLKESGYAVGGSIGPIGLDLNGAEGYYGVEINVGIGILPEGHGLYTYTDIISLNSLSSFIKDYMIFTVKHQYFFK